jgi:hypothetical protein
MDNQDKPIELNIQPIDYVASATKSFLGAVPFAGSLLAELAGTIIPNQRIDRIARFAEILENKIASLEQEFVRSQLTNENFSDLFEEGLRQAARSLTNERREYIGSLIINSLSQQDIEYIESKHLLRILGELNDIEIIWLMSYLDPAFDKDDEFRERHSDILTPAIVTFSDSPIALDKKALQESYKEHLSYLGLLKPRYKVDTKTHLPKFDKSTGAQEINGYIITQLGRLLLEQISLANPTE